MTAKSVIALVAAWLAVSPVFAATFTEAPDDIPVAEAPAAPAAVTLIDTISHQLGVTNAQAVGGTGALLGLALNTLQGADQAQLQQSLPGIDQLAGNSALGGLGGLGSLLGGTGGANALLGGVGSLQDVDQIFGVLGMDQSMIGQFAGVLLDYFVKQGLNSQLLGTLGGIWGAPASPAVEEPIIGRGA
ncbi:hypothetical protein D9M71_337560 [compost metagenome]